MNQLSLEGQQFTTGRLTYLDHPAESAETSAKIWVRVRPRGVDFDFTAQLDTGAAWSILNREVAELAGLFDAQPIAEPTMDSRHGRIKGRLVRTGLLLVAEIGQSLQLESTVFVSRDWTYPNFIGYGGFLERVRFAIDPAQSRNQFHFGAGA